MKTSTDVLLITRLYQSSRCGEQLYNYLNDYKRLKHFLRTSSRTSWASERWAYRDFEIFKSLNVNPRISESCIGIKIKLNFSFHNSLGCLKRFYEGLQSLHKIFWGTAKKFEH